MEQPVIPGFRFVPRTGVIYVMHEAAQRGFTYDDPSRANLGQGSPETGPLPDAPPRRATECAPYPLGPCFKSHPIEADSWGGYAVFT